MAARPSSPSPRRRTRPAATVVVVGSVNMDLVARVPRLPGPGETLAGSEFHTLPGGKGANQAVAVARLGGRAVFVGRVGADAFGQRLREGLRAEGVEVRHLGTDPRRGSGVAIIGVEDSGQNAITLVPGANAGLRPADLRALEPVIARADALLVQLEIPLDTAAAALRIARRHGVFTVLDTAPVPPGGLPPRLFREIDLLSPNQTEARQLSGLECETPQQAAAAAAELVARYDPGLVVLKLGALGALAHAGPGIAPLHQPAFPVRSVDTTAAGDAFTAALTLRLAEGTDLGDALRFASATGALAVTRMGAQDAMPSRAEVERFLRRPPARPRSPRSSPSRS